MSYKIDCPFCNQRLEVPPELDNTTTLCPSCNQEIYLSRADAVEDLDPAAAALRRELEASEKRHQEQLRMMMAMSASNSQNQTKQIVNVLLWLFVYIPLIAGGIWIFIITVLSVIG